MIVRDCVRVFVCVCLFIGVRVQGLAGVSSTSPPGGNQVDGLPPAPVHNKDFQNAHVYKKLVRSTVLDIRKIL